jgi:hypothetical protein
VAAEFYLLPNGNDDSYDAEICLEGFRKNFLYECHQNPSNHTPEYALSS